MAFVHGVRRLPGGRVRVKLSSRERQILRSLPDQLRALLVADPEVPGAQEVAARLFPSAYEDPLDELEYRELVGRSLGEERLAAVDAFAETLEGGTAKRLVWSTELDADQAAAWLSATNDARLALGVLLGITVEEEWEAGAVAGDPSRLLLHYLGWLQEELLAALLAELDDAESG